MNLSTIMIVDDIEFTANTFSKAIGEISELFAKTLIQLELDFLLLKQPD